jgi:outer membrane protein TolC
VALVAAVLTIQIGANRAAYAEHLAPSRNATRADAAGDDLFAGATVLERGALVDAVLARNPTVEAARAAWRAAAAVPEREGAFDDPMLGYSIAPESIGVSDMRGGHVVELKQKLPFFGKRGLRAAAAEAEARVAETDYEGMRREVALMASMLFDDYYVAERAAEANRRHHALLGEMLESAKARYATGAIRQHDLVRVELEQAHLRHDVTERDTERDVALAGLNALLHRSPRAPLPPPPASLALGDIAGDEASWIEEALAVRPDVAAARARVEAAGARVDLARREYFPDVSVGGEYNSMWDDVEHRWMVGVEMEVPLQLRRRSAEVAAAEAEAASRRADLAAVLDRIGAEIETARARLDEAAHIASLYRDHLLPAARDVVASARAGLSATTVEFGEMIDAEHELRDIELESEMALATQSRRRAELERAIGRVPGVTR